MATVIDPSTAVYNVVVGKILHKDESGVYQPIDNLLVDLLDLDNGPDPESGDGAIARGATLSTPADVAALYKLGDRIGSAITDASGRFRFDVVRKDFNLPRTTETKPDLVLVVLAPDQPGLDLAKRVLHFSKDVRLNAGSQEAYVICFTTAFFKEHDIPFGAQREQRRDTARDLVGAYVAERTRERDYSVGVAEFHSVEATRETQARKVSEGLR